MPAYETILYDVQEGVARLTLNRPEKKNAFNPEMLCLLADAWDMIDGGAGTDMVSFFDLSKSVRVLLKNGTVESGTDSNTRRIFFRNSCC